MHRILLIGDDALARKAIEAELRMSGQPVVGVSDVTSAGAVARQAQPSVVVLLADMDEQSGMQLIATALVHPATAVTPTVLVTRSLDLEGAVRALQSGIVNVISGKINGARLLTELDRSLGDGPQDPRRRAALDRRGPTVLRRIGDLLRGHGASGVLRVETERGEASLEFEDGHIREAKAGQLEGGAAIRTLLASTTKAPWAFNLLKKNGEEEVADVLIESWDSVDLDIDIDESTNPGFNSLSVGDTAEGGLRVVLADDDPDLVNLYTSFMQRRGWSVLPAANGREAYDLAVAHRPDVIVSDIMMPDTDGWGFLTSVRDDHRIRETPFLMLSCHGDYLANLKSLEAGADDYLEKGLRGEEVLTRVEKTVSRRFAFRDTLDPRAAVSGSIRDIGPQFLLSTLTERRVSGSLEVQHGWATHRIFLHTGAVYEALSELGDHQERGEDALARFMASDDGSYMYLPTSSAAEPRSSTINFLDVRDGLAVRLNREREAVREKLLAADATLVFDEDRFEFYATVAADAVRPVIDALVNGDSPRDVMASSIASPILVEWVVKDLLRKRIAIFA